MPWEGAGTVRRKEVSCHGDCCCFLLAVSEQWGGMGAVSGQRCGSCSWLCMNE